MVKPANTSAIEKETEMNWQTWCELLDGSGAADADHNAIVKLAHTFKEISGWWAQEIAVAYEQHIGRRKPGQMSNGLFSASVSRTLANSLEPAFEQWRRFAASMTEISGKRIVGAPTTSRTPKRLYWRCKFDDGSAVSIGFEPRGESKVLVGIEHRKIRREADISKSKSGWASMLTDCFKL